MFVNTDLIAQVFGSNTAAAATDNKTVLKGTADVLVIPDLANQPLRAFMLDGRQPLQVSAANMEPARLKREFGQDLTFWGGGCDTQTVLARGTPADVRAEVRRRVDVFAPGGGFVFCQVHNILFDVPAENVLAMYEELGTLTR